MVLQFREKKRYQKADRKEQPEPQEENQRMHNTLGAE